MTRPPPLPSPGQGVIINGAGPHDWLETYQTVALVTLAALPVAALVAWALARRRLRAGDTPTWAWRTSLAEVGLLYGSLPWLWLTLLPASGHATYGAVSLEPLSDLPTMPTYQVVGNLFVLSALGFFAPLRFSRLASIPRILAVSAFCSVLIETSQYVLQLGRVSSVDDVLLNTVGAVVAAFASRRWWRTRRSVRIERPERSKIAPAERLV